MKFLPGDVYIYDSIHGYHRLYVRSDEGRWVILPNDPTGPIFDSDMEKILASETYHPGLDREVFIRRGVDLRPEVALGYLDNVQF